MENIKKVYDFYENTDDLMKHKEKRAQLLRYLNLTEQVPELLGISSHMIAVCSKDI